ncbi:MAG TPA: adenylate/guanylate cyclase domain-containing protein [Bacteroidia bacterium]|nr:adenylate/guanylate cyclase domain-containing protein [Bacteroidia bacterium]
MAMNIKKIVLNSFLIIWFLPLASAQTHKIDSLKKVLKNQKEDTNKVNTFNSLADKLRRISKYDSAMIFAGEALELATKLGFESGIGSAYNTFGNCYFYQGLYAKALNNYQLGLFAYEDGGGKQGTSFCQNGMGNVYKALGNYPKALDYYNKALDADEEIKDDKDAAFAIGNIATIYIGQQNYSRALELYNKALRLARKIGDKEIEAINMGNIGYLYKGEGKYDSALEYSFKALELDEKIKYTRGVAITLGNLGEIYNGQNQYEKSLEYSFKALAIIREIHSNSLYAWPLESIGYSYLKQNKYAESKIYLDSALLVSKGMGRKDDIKNEYNSLAELDSAKGDYKAEVQDKNNYFIYRDSLINQKTLQTEMNYEYQRQADSSKAEQDKQKAINLKESQRQKVIKNSFIGGFSIMFLAAGLFFFQRRRISKEKKRSDDLLLNILPAETAEELKATGKAKAKSFDMVSVMFTDFKDFTKISEKLSPTELVEELHYLFHAFDNIIHAHNLEKIKTIGDSYMSAGGLPVPNKTNAKDVVSAALEIVGFMERHKNQRAKEGKEVFEIRIGINTGPVVAGIVGVKKFAYDIWGDTVNLASRMESSGEAGKVNISGSTYEMVKNDFNCTYRGKIQAKNKGEVDMYFVEGRSQREVTV